MPPRLLVVYYSRTGITKKIAGSIASTLDADLDEIVDQTKRSGLLGYLRSGFQASFQRRVPIGPAIRDPAKYDLVAIGTPVWDRALSSPVRSYLHRHRNSFHDVAFFCTCGGRGADRVFAQMTELCTSRPVATLVVLDREVDQAGPMIDRFATEIRHAIGVTSAPAIAPSPIGPTVR
jgi:flavodoxin